MPESVQTQTLLSGKLIGQPLRNSNGIRCCPAIEEETGKQYIAKIISIPASQAQADALLLSGAYKTEDEVLEYFRSQAEDLVQEARYLSELSAEYSFVPFQKWEVLSMPDGIGFRVILLSDFHQNIQQKNSKSWTHLDAINMCLDVCTVLETCRQTGYIYANLKPSNIFVCNDGRYCIGDFGMIPLASLKYASLPEKYRSDYTPPEISDAYASINETIDTYALGLFLYQLYNGSMLPQPNTDGSLPYPQYADYELAQIILKACNANPAARFSSPAEMANALVGYMQKIGVNDVPIIPVAAVQEASAKVVENFMTEEENDAQFDALLAAVPEIRSVEEQTYDTQHTSDSSVEDMLAHADDLISHVLPEPVVAPSVIDVPIPAPLDLGKTDEQPIAEDMPLFDPIIELPEKEEPIPQLSEIQAAEPAAEENENDALAQPESSAKKKPFIFIGVACGILALLLTAFLLFYNLYYLQNIDDILIDVQGSTVNITIVSDIRDDLLSVVCVDTYGTTQSPAIHNGKVTLTGLDPNMQYRIYVQISGTHKLTGKTSTIFTSTAHTHIREFTAECGRLDGDAVLTFLAEGQGVPAWTIRYSAEGEPEKEISFPGNTVTLHSLTIGKEYTFRLIPQGDYTIDGIDEIKYTVQKIVIAENLSVVAGTENSITVQWNLPAGVQSQLWVVRCYNDSGYEKTVETDNTQFTFTDLDLTTGYTIIVSAKNMTKSATITVPADPVFVSGFATDESKSAKVKLTWTSTRAVGKWTVSYRIDGAEAVTVTATENAVTLPRTPGCIYFVNITAENTNLFGGYYEFTASMK